MASQFVADYTRRIFIGGYRPDQSVLTVSTLDYIIPAAWDFDPAHHRLIKQGGSANLTSTFTTKQPMRFSVPYMLRFFVHSLSGGSVSVKLKNNADAATLEIVEISSGLLGYREYVFVVESADLGGLTADRLLFTASGSAVEMIIADITLTEMQDFTTIADKCSFSWTDCGGCDKCSIGIGIADFDATYGIQQGDSIIIAYGDDLQGGNSTRMWSGIVMEIETTLTNGLSIVGAGSRVLLLESMPTGLFGEDVKTTSPTSISATSSAVAEDVTGIQRTLALRILFRSIDAEGTTNYQDATVSAASPLGYNVGTPYRLDIPALTIPAGRKLDLSWVCGNGALGTEIELIFDPGGGSERHEFYDAVGDTISIDGIFSPTEGTTFAAAHTALEPTIANYAIEDVVNHMLDVFMPPRLGKGIVDIGSRNVNVDFLDYRNSSADLSAILSALRDIAGTDVQWYVDQYNLVHFVQYSTTSAKTFTPLQTGITVQSTDRNLLIGLTKRQSRDGVTLVKVEGEKALEDGTLGVTDADWNVSKSVPALDDFPIVGGGTPHDSSIIGFVQDQRFFSTAQSKRRSPVIPVGADKSFVDGFATLSDWLAMFPNQPFIYIKKETLPPSLITDWMDKLRSKMINTNNPFSPVDGEQFVTNRPRIFPLPAPGVSTIKTAGILAHNFMLKRNPNPVAWSATITAMDTLYIPGQDRVTIINQAGYSYALDIRGIEYTMGDVLTASLTLGDIIVGPKEEDVMYTGAIVKAITRPYQAPKWLT